MSQWDTDRDGILSPDEAAQVTEMYLYYSYDISSLSGIEYFTGLEYLDCRDNQLKSLDLSKNTALVTLDCDYNQLSSLNLSGCTSLRELHCLYNELPSLDISNNTALTSLNCYGNPGDGISKFPVKAWFDNYTVPDYFYIYYGDYWWYLGDVQITIDFQKVV